MKNSNQLTRFIAMVSIFSAIFLLGFIGKAFSQVTLDKITVTEGKGAMTSGFDVVISLSNQNGVLFGAQANNERANIRVGKTYGNFTLLATAGVFKNVPWAGPMLLYNYKCIDFCFWGGFGMATNKYLTNPGWKPEYFFTYEEVGLTLGKNRFAYGLMSFTTEKLNNFAIYKRTFLLSANHQFFVETTYDFNKVTPMFVLGYKYSFSKK